MSSPVAMVRTFVPIALSAALPAGLIACPTFEGDVTTSTAFLGGA